MTQTSWVPKVPKVSSVWDKGVTLAESLYILRQMALRHTRLAGPAGRTLEELILRRDWAGVCAYEVPYNNPEISVTALINIRQALAFFTKLEDLEIGVDKVQVGLNKFLASEAKCGETNKFFQSVSAGGTSLLPRDVCILDAARRKIRQILGTLPAPAELPFAFGPGSTSTLKKREACPTNKMAGSLSCSYNLYVAPELSSYLREVPHWTSQHSSWYIDEDGWLCEEVSLEVSPGVLEFVPKNAKEYRTIVKPATLNSFLQKGYGTDMTRRLKRAGIDITDQTLNQRLAREGSLTGELATLDLSSASDLIARELVRFLLPSEWYRALSVVREDSVMYKGQEILLEKFSSMGNGYTFPLETLIFWALTWSASAHKGRVASYGDDIICHVDDAREVMRVLELCGFAVNKAKSYWAGPFRESCGKDYYKGIDIRPYYQKKLVSGESLFVLHNFYARNLDDDACRFVRRYLHPDLFLFGPDGYGDGHLIGDFSRVRKASWLKKGYGGFAFDSFTKVARKQFPRYPGDWISPLYACYTSAYSKHRESGLEFAPLQSEKTKSGFPLWGLPGDDGYKRISIYTLAL